MYSLNRARSTEDAQLQHLTIKYEALEAEYHTINLEKKEYETEIEELKQKIDLLQQENKSYIELLNLEQQRKPALNAQINSMTTSLRAINSEKTELQRKVTEYGQLIKILTTENYEIKESNEKYKIALENYNKQKESTKQIQNEMNETNGHHINRIIELETENQALREQLNLIKNNVLINEPDEKSRDDYHIAINSINDSNSNISKPNFLFIKAGATPIITPRMTPRISRIYSTQTIPNIDELTPGIPTAAPMTPSLIHPQFITIDTFQNAIIDQYPQLNGAKFSHYSQYSNISQLNHQSNETPNTDYIESVYPYIVEEEEEDGNDKKLSEIMVGYKQKIQDLQSELADCYIEIAHLKGNIDSLKHENDALLSNKNKKMEDKADNDYNNKLHILRAMFFKG